MNEDAAPRPRRTALRSLTAIDPYDTYRSAGEQSLVNWDDSLGGWTVLGFDECSAVLKDDSTFVMAWTTLEGGDAALGKYGIFNLTGEAHELTTISAESTLARDVQDFVTHARSQKYK